MRKKFVAFLFFVVCKSVVYGHCQMPCGIYHDQMIYDKVDEFYLTMFKAISALKNSPFATVKERNHFIRWVVSKEKQCDEIAHILTEYFLQQKIKPSMDENTIELVHVVHDLLFLLVQIKQTADLDIVKEFGREWEHFKYLFHSEEGCEKPILIEPKWTDEDEKKWQEEKAKAKKSCL